MAHSNLQDEVQICTRRVDQNEDRCSINQLTTWDLPLLSLIKTNKHFQVLWLLFVPQVWRLKHTHCVHSSVYNVITIRVNSRYYQSEQSLLSEWTVITIRVNSHYYQSELSLLSEWAVITIRVNSHYYQSELSLLSEWAVITIRVNSHYYQSEQSLLSEWPVINP